MAVTRVERKHRVNRRRAAARRKTLKQNNFQPVIRKVDVEAIKKEFEEKNS